MCILTHEETLKFKESNHYSETTSTRNIARVIVLLETEYRGVRKSTEQTIFRDRNIERFISSENINSQTG